MDKDTVFGSEKRDAFALGLVTFGIAFICFLGV